MNFAKQISMVSAFALMTIASAGYADAQSKKGSGDQNNYCAENPDQCGGGMNKPGNEDQGYTKKPRYQQEEDQTGDQQEQPKMRQAQGDWKFDPSKQQRRRHKDATFRFFLGGYWYPEQYWQGYGMSIGRRISCREGSMILRDRGFYRVRPIECDGRTYTYFGRRHGDSVTILLNSRNGRIIGVNPS